MISLDLSDPIRASALRHTHKSGAGFQIYRRRVSWRRWGAALGFATVCAGAADNLAAGVIVFGLAAAAVLMVERRP